MDHLIPGDIVLPDRGFDISDSVGIMQAKILENALNFESIIIANVRIHVDRVIGNARPVNYTCIQYVISIENNGPIIDNIICVCCALCNVCDAVVPLSKMLLCF